MHIITSDVDSYTRKILSDMTEHQHKDKDPWLSFIANIPWGIRMTRVWEKLTFGEDRKELFWVVI